MTTTLTATVQPTYGRVLLQLVWTGGVTSAAISRVHADGTIWPLRTANPIDVTSTMATCFDNECPLDQAVTYLASSSQTSTTFSSSPVTVTSDPGWAGSMIWLTHPSRPSLSMLLAVNDIAAQTRSGRNGILQILGSPLGVALTDVRVNTGSSMTALTMTKPDTAALKALLADGSVLLMRPPGAWSTPWQYIALGDVTDVTPGPGPIADRQWTLPYTVVASPVGGAMGSVGSTYADAKAAYATYAALKLGEPTYADLKAKAGP